MTLHRQTISPGLPGRPMAALVGSLGLYQAGLLQAAFDRSLTLGRAIKGALSAAPAPQMQVSTRQMMAGREIGPATAKRL